jgi:hypothetical protein
MEKVKNKRDGKSKPGSSDTKTEDGELLEGNSSKLRQIKKRLHI